MSVGDRITGAADRVARAVTNHNRIVILMMLVMTAGVAFGFTQDQGENQNSADESVIEGTAVYDAQQYLDAQYFDEDETSTVAVYVRSESGSVLSKPGLLAALDYQIEVSNSGAVADVLADGRSGNSIQNPATAVATQLTEDADSGLATQREALAAASSEEVAEAVRTVFAGGEQTRQLLPVDYEAGTTDADGMRLLLTLSEDAGSDVTDAIGEATAAIDTPASLTVFTTAGAFADLNVLPELVWLVVPLILLVLAIILGFAYRDVTDVIVSFTGVILALVWTFGLMGWLGLLGQTTALVVPVLVIALSIDFSFHVFMRYRERRDPGDSIRDALSRSTAAVMIAFTLVTVTAVISFLPNLTNPVALIRDLSVAFVLAVLASLVIFTTLVPALKVSADGLWERFGFDRTATPLGRGSYLHGILGSSVTTAQRAGIVVILLALIISVAGAVAFTEVDRQQFQDNDLLSDPGWQSELPGPMAYEVHETDAAQQLSYEDERFGASEGDSDSTFGFTQFLIRGEVATPETMQALVTAEEAAAAADDEVVLNQGGVVDVRSPLSAMQEFAAANPDSAFAETFAAAAGTEATDPATLQTLVPEQDVTETLDAFVEAAPQQATQLLEQTEDGYASMRVLVPTQGGFGDDRTAAMNTIEKQVDAETAASVTGVGSGTLNDAYLSQIIDGIFTTMALALIGVFVVLAVVYRATYGSATLGLVTALPVALELGVVFLGMLLLNEPLTANTALIVSIAIGLGIDYNIHISDRFVTELERGADTVTALTKATTGTGGALLGSAITSAGAFALLVIAPLAVFQSIGTILGLTLAASFLLSVFVLPSLLYQWANLVDAREYTVAESPAPSD